jgi:hypothetical protein
VDEFNAFEELLREVQAGRVVADDLRRLIDNLGALPEETAFGEYGFDELFEAVEECSKFLFATLA